MSEINKNYLETYSQNNLQGIKKSEKQSTQEAEEKSETKEMQDASNPALESLGRSQVKAPSADNIENDLKVFMENNKKIESAEHFFDIAYEQFQKAGDKEAFEKAALLTGEYCKDFLNIKQS